MKEMAHIGLVVRDSDHSAVFYSEVLGCKIFGNYQDERVKIVFLKSGNGVIELVQYLNGQYEPRSAGTVDHIAFEVANMEEELEKLKQLGVPLLWETPREVLESKKAIFFSGPDGERLEFIQEEKS